MRRIIISTDARADLDADWYFYEMQETGLGDYFLSSLRADIDGLRVTAGIHKIVEDYHRLLSRVFPHGIFYTLNGETVTVWAVVDLRRDPDWIYERLRG